MSNLPDLDSILAQSNPGDISGVIALMAQIDAKLDPVDGIACFNHLYRTVTEHVKVALETQVSPENAFLTSLDVTFAAMYFDALREYSAGKLTRRAWLPLLDARSSSNIAPIQFALAGMNAHINRDLPVGIVDTWAGASPSDAQHAAFTSINPILVQVEADLRTNYFRGVWASRRFAHEEDAVSMWSVEAAREAAWDNAAVIAALRAHGHDQLAEAYINRMDGIVELAGRGLLLA